MQLFFRPFELLARIDEEPCCDGNDAKECGVGECIVPAIVGDEECSDDRSEDAADISQRFIQPDTEPVYLPPREITVDQLALMEKPSAPKETLIQKIVAAAPLAVCAAM